MMYSHSPRDILPTFGKVLMRNRLLNALGVAFFAFCAFMLTVLSPATADPGAGSKPQSMGSSSSSQDNNSVLDRDVKAIEAAARKAMAERRSPIDTRRGFKSVLTGINGSLDGSRNPCAASGDDPPPYYLTVTYPQPGNLNNVVRSGNGVSLVSSRDTSGYHFHGAGSTDPGFIPAGRDLNWQYREGVVPKGMIVISHSGDVRVYEEFPPGLTFHDPNSPPARIQVCAGIDRQQGLPPLNEE